MNIVMAVQRIKKWVRFFEDDPVLLKELSQLAEIHTYSKGDCIVLQQDRSRDVFYILDGQARALSISPDGQEIFLSRMGPGSLFGEVAALGDGQRSATVVADRDLELAKFSGDDFLGLMGRFGSIGIAVSRLLVTRTDNATRRLCELSSLPAKARVAAELVRLSGWNETHLNSSNVIKTMPTNADIARSINSARETVSRTLSMYESEGLISRKGSRLTIHSMEALLDKID